MKEKNETHHPIVGPEKGADVEVRVTGLPAERLGEAAGLLARCFHTNPNYTRSSLNECSKRPSPGIASLALRSGTPGSPSLLGTAELDMIRRLVRDQTARDRKARGPDGEGGMT